VGFSRTYRWKALRIRGTDTCDEVLGKQILAVSEPLGQPNGAKAVTGGVGGRLIGLAFGPQC
jgi:hypothetical protein